MKAITNTGNKAGGFTIIELLVVLLLIALLASVAVPVINKSIVRAKESALKENLFVMRKALDDYYADHGAYPPELSLLVEQRYIRYIPPDPLTSQKRWQLVYSQAGNEQQAGVINLHSYSTELSTEGNRYNEW